MTGNQLTLGFAESETPQTPDLFPNQGYSAAKNDIIHTLTAKVDIYRDGKVVIRPLKEQA